MCGIAGAFDSDRPMVWVRHINRMQAHRGPDDEVAVELGRMALGNTRLAIQEPTPAGNQPYVSTDGRYFVVFNGELYNHVELGKEYGIHRQSRCDGEILPHLWTLYGVEAFRLLRGMYAIAIADTREGTLTLARDRFGIKPLYWRRFEDSGIAFASELRSLATLESTPTIRPEAIGRFLHLGALGPDETPFSELEAVAPNTAVTFSVDGAVRVHVSAHDHLGAPPAPDPDVARSRLLQEFRTSVDLHLRSDVPTALLLSAGVDSSALAAAAAGGGHQLHCITVVGQAVEDESALAAATARHYGHVHETVEARLSADDVHVYFRHMQRPTIDGLNTFLVCKAVNAAGFKVALSGLGGDEALAGYSHARLLPLLGPLAALRKVPEAARVRAAGVLGRVEPRFHSPKGIRLLDRDGPDDAWGLSLLQRELFSAERVERLCGVDPQDSPGVARPAELAGMRTNRALAQAEAWLYMGSMLLPDADAFSMAWSVELRVPYVDWPFFDAALAMADVSKRRFSKKTLIDLLADAYLTGLSRRPKTGFAVPMRSWLSDGTLQDVVDAAKDPSAPVWDFVELSEGKEVLTRPTPARWSEPWALCVLNEWLLAR